MSSVEISRKLKRSTVVGRKTTPEPLEQPAPKSNVLLLTSSLLTDRMFVYSNVLERLSLRSEVSVWSVSFNNPRHIGMWKSVFAKVEKFPHVDPFPEFPHNYLRRLNEFVWDYSQKPPSRISLLHHRKQGVSWELKLLKPLARILALLRLERAVEHRVESLMLSYNRSAESVDRLRTQCPNVVVTTGPFQFKQPAISVAARKLGIRTLALIPSWDNLSTKKRMVLNYDGYLVWSERSKEELHYFYPETTNKPVYVIGAPQFDVFFDETLFQSREEFFRHQGLDPDLPVIVYAVGSPNFLAEHHGALYLANRVANGDLGNVQMLVRPHPLHNDVELASSFEKFGKRVAVQKTVVSGDRQIGRTQDKRQIIEWINTFRHADVVVNLSSTVTVDAAIFDTPVVNLDFDPQPGQVDQQLIKDINHRWTHFKPIAESGGVFLVNNFDEMLDSIRKYLAHPELHRENRRWIADYVCGYLDGKSGERMADAILDFVAQNDKGN